MLLLKIYNLNQHKVNMEPTHLRNVRLLQITASIAADVQNSAHLQIDLYVYSRNPQAQCAFALKEDMVVLGVNTHIFGCHYESSCIVSRGFVAYVSVYYVKSIVGTLLVGNRSDRLHSTGRCELQEGIVASCQVECADAEFLNIFEALPKPRILLQLPDIGTSVLESVAPALTEQLAHSLLCDKEPAQDCTLTALLDINATCAAMRTMLFRENFQHSIKKPWKTCGAQHSWAKTERVCPFKVKSRLMSYLRM